MKTYLILSAVRDEQSYYEKHFADLFSVRIGHIEASYCDYQGVRLYFSSTGVGTINAALTLATLCAEIAFDAVFFSGSSGAVANDLRIGDVVIADQCFDADIYSVFDQVEGTPFEDCMINPHNERETPRIFDADPKLLALVSQVSWPFTCRIGRVASSNLFPAPPSQFEQIKSLNTQVIDMESAAIYQYSWLTGIPSLVVRGVSNALDDDGNDDAVADSDVTCADRAAEVVLLCIHTLLQAPNTVVGAEK